MVGYKSSFPGFPSPVTAERGKKQKKKIRNPPQFGSYIVMRRDAMRCVLIHSPRETERAAPSFFFLQLYLSALFAVEAGHVHMALSMEGKGTNFCW